MSLIISDERLKSFKYKRVQKHLQASQGSGSSTFVKLSRTINSYMTYHWVNIQVRTISSFSLAPFAYKFFRATA